jgi:hypothetical protein
MGRSAVLASGLFVLAAGAGCSTKPLQEPDAGGTGPIGFDAPVDPPFDATVIDVRPISDTGTIIDTGVGPFDTAGPLTDAPPDTPSIDAGPLFPGLRAYTVASVFQTDGGVIGVGPVPASHTFTLVLDGNQRLAISGGRGEGNVTPFEQTATGTGGAAQSFRTTGGAHRFSLSAGGCSGSSVTYSEIAVAVDGAGNLIGTGSGQLLVVSGDVGLVVASTMLLTGVADSQPPTLTSPDATDPFSAAGVTPSEPLPPGAVPTLRSASGDAMALLASSSARDFFFTLFSRPPFLLRYSEQYTVSIDGIRDFAGYPAVAGSGLTFTTGPRPPLAAEDGFESVPESGFAGAKVLSGADAISGARSLYIPPASFPTAPPRLAFRLAVAPGDRFLRFAYRTVNPSSSTAVYFAMGSEGGLIIRLALPGDPPPLTQATIDGTAVTLGPTMTFAAALSADVTDEIVVQRTGSPAACGFPSPPIPGIIIDDVRVE